MILSEVIKLGFFYGCFIGLVALGFALIYSILHIVDFAHTDRLVACGYIYVTVLNYTNHLCAIIITVFSGIILAVLTELVVYRKIRKINPNLLLLSTFGLSIVAQNVMALIFTDNLLEYPFVESTLSGLGIYPRELIIFPTLLLCTILLYYWLKKTKSGISIRAMISNKERAIATGVPINKLYLLVFGLSGLMSAFGGVYLSMGYGLKPYSGFRIMILAFSACLIAGMNNVYGSVLVGIVIGILISVFEFYFNALSAEMITLLILIVVLFIKPHGIFGQKLRLV